jgi:uncharacterized protein YaiL (DUF2058 family)
MSFSPFLLSNSFNNNNNNPHKSNNVPHKNSNNCILNNQIVDNKKEKEIEKEKTLEKQLSKTCEKKENSPLLNKYIENKNF